MRKPRWLRQHTACPECGHIYESSEAFAQHVIREKRIEFGTYGLWREAEVGVKCPMCEVYLEWVEFWLENEKKWGHFPLETDVED